MARIEKIERGRVQIPFNHFICQILICEILNLFLINNKRALCLNCFLSESEVLVCKLKALDSSPSKVRKSLLPKVGGSSSSARDVNVLPNNKILPSCGGAKPIPLDQMKCNILKSRVNQENSKNSEFCKINLLFILCY